MRSSIFIALAAGWMALMPAASAAPVAMVTDLQGVAAVSKSAAAKDGARLALLAYIEAGSEIQVEANGRLTLTYLAKPVEQSFSGPAKIRVSADKIEVLQGAAGTSRKLDPEKISAARKFEPAARERMTQATFVMRAAPPPAGKLELLGPSESKVAGLTPEFAWKGPKDAHNYKLSLLDEYGKPLIEHNLTATTWKPAGKRALAYGKAYNWKVDATLASGQVESAQTRFVTLDKASAAKIGRQKPKANAPFSERLLYAALLEGEGLKYESAAAWRALAAERPDDPTLQTWVK